MKVLYVATVRSHIGQFHMPVIHALKEAGHEVHAAFHDNSADKPGLDLSVIDQTFEVPFVRSPYSPQNLKACKVLKKIIDEGDVRQQIRVLPQVRNNNQASNTSAKSDLISTRRASNSGQKSGWFLHLLYHSPPQFPRRGGCLRPGASSRSRSSSSPATTRSTAPARRSRQTENETASQAGAVSFYGCRSITSISGRLKIRGTVSCPESPEVMIMRISSFSIYDP